MSGEGNETDDQGTFYQLTRLCLTQERFLTRLMKILAEINHNKIGNDYNELVDGLWQVRAQSIDVVQIATNYFSTKLDQEVIEEEKVMAELEVQMKMEETLTLCLGTNVEDEEENANEDKEDEHSRFSSGEVVNEDEGDLDASEEESAFSLGEEGEKRTHHQSNKRKHFRDDMSCKGSVHR
jgi:hypothetical protein